MFKKQAAAHLTPIRGKFERKKILYHPKKFEQIPYTGELNRFIGYRDPKGQTQSPILQTSYYLNKKNMV